jgi:hypothetical protein
MPLSAGPSLPLNNLFQPAFSRAENKKSAKQRNSAI